MLSITLRDLVYRYRQFLIAVVGAGVVFGMALVLTGLANSFRVEVDNTVDSVGADAWVLPDGSTGPFTSFGALPESTVEQVSDMAGVEQADPLAIVPTTTTFEGEVRPLRLIGHRLGGLGTPNVVEGRSAERVGEVVADKRLHADVGERVDLAGTELTVVGVTSGLTLLGGIPNVYASLEDVQEVAFQGAPLITTVVTTGTPTDPTTDVAVLSSDQVKEDTFHAMKDAISSIESSRTLMWVVAAIIVAALMYVSALERLRDFAVLKSLGSSSRLLFFGVAVQAVTITLLAAVFAVGAAQLIKPTFALPIVMPSSAFVVLPVVAILVGLLSSLVALRRAIAVDPSSAFAAAS
ncbi:MAG: ABC transporter permease [Acidimicrobiales bacterium]